MKPFSKKILLISYLSFFVASVCQAQSLSIFAAASLTQPITQIAQLFEKQENIKVITVFAASSTLARQIARNAPADIYISANQKWMNYLLNEKKIDSTSIQTLLENQLVLSAPIQSNINPIEVLNSHTFNTYLAGQLIDAKLATGNVDHVPLGIYAKQALISLDIWPTIKNKLALTSNARAALAFAEKAAVPLALVYKTDALSSKKVKIIAEIDQQHHEKIIYPMAIVANKETDKSQLLYDFLRSSQAQQVFSQYGFKPHLTTGN
jgi:molybdate transport system substrate-binding protein